MLPQFIQNELGQYLPGPISGWTPVGGGCIANACRIEASGQSFFLKWSEGAAARTFPAEAAGLRALAEAQSPLVLPKVQALQKGNGGAGFLLMEWIESGGAPRDFWERFGRGLAELHHHIAERYGFEADNFIGRLPQQNGWKAEWPAFFRECRLTPQVEMARDRGRWQAAWDGALDHLFARLDTLLPVRPPASILHGDLWSGNFLVDSSGRATLFDPAAYFGHREADLALTELFGGFEERFYAAYHEAWPLEAGYDERREVYNLYHLVNHLNHFGGSYAGSVARTLYRFG